MPISAENIRIAFRAYKNNKFTATHLAKMIVEFARAPQTEKLEQKNLIASLMQELTQECRSSANKLKDLQTQYATVKQIKNLNTAISFNPDELPNTITALENFTKIKLHSLNRAMTQKMPLGDIKEKIDRITILKALCERLNFFYILKPEYELSLENIFTMKCNEFLQTFAKDLAEFEIPTLNSSLNLNTTTLLEVLINLVESEDLEYRALIGDSEDENTKEIRDLQANIVSEAKLKQDLRSALRQVLNVPDGYSWKDVLFGLENHPYSKQRPVDLSANRYILASLDEQRFQDAGVAAIEDLSATSGSTYSNKDGSNGLSQIKSASTARLNTIAISDIAATNVNIYSTATKGSYCVAKQLTRLAAGYFTSKQLIDNLANIFAATREAAKIKGVQSASGLVSKVFYKNDREVELVAAMIGDCCLLAWDPLTQTLTPLLLPRSYKQEHINGIIATEFKPVSIIDQWQPGQLQVYSGTISRSACLIQMTQGAFAALPQAKQEIGIDNYSQNCLFAQAKLDLTKIHEYLIQLPQSHSVNQLNQHIKQYILESQEAQRLILLEEYRRLENLIEQYQRSYSPVANIQEFIVWVEAQHAEFYAPIRMMLEKLNISRSKFASMTLQDLNIRLYNNLDIGNDFSLQMRRADVYENNPQIALDEWSHWYHNNRIASKQEGDPREFDFVVEKFSDKIAQTSRKQKKQLEANKKQWEEEYANIHKFQKDIRRKHVERILVKMGNSVEYDSPTGLVIQECLGKLNKDIGRWYPKSKETQHTIWGSAAQEALLNKNKQMMFYYSCLAIKSGDLIGHYCLAHHYASTGNRAKANNHIRIIDTSKNSGQKYYLLGLLARHGIGMEANELMARKMFSQSAEEKYIPGCNAYAINLIENPDSTPEDLKLALENLHLAINANYLFADIALGRFLLSTKYLNSGFDPRVQAWREAGMSEIGVNYKLQIEAFSYLSRATEISTIAQDGVQTASSQLITTIQELIQEVLVKRGTERTCFGYTLDSYREHGYRGDFRVSLEGIFASIAYFNHQNSAVAQHFAKLACAKHDPMGWYILAFMAKEYRQDDLVTACAYHMQKYCDENHPHYKYVKGLMYENGIFHNADPIMAQKYYDEAIAVNYPPAMYQHGLLLSKSGDDVDEERGNEFLNYAINNGFVEANKGLAWNFYFDRGTKTIRTMLRSQGFSDYKIRLIILEGDSGLGIPGVVRLLHNANQFYDPTKKIDRETKDVFVEIMREMDQISAAIELEEVDTTAATPVEQGDVDRDPTRDEPSCTASM